MFTVTETLEASHMGNIIKIESVIYVDASPDKIWGMIGNFHRCWIDEIEVIRVDDETRRMATPEGGAVIEQLVKHSDQSRSMTYRKIKGDLPVKNYESTLSVVSCASTHRTKVSWASSFQAEGVDDATAHNVVSGLYQMGLDALASSALGL